MQNTDFVGNVVSGECRSEHYPGESVEEVMKLMMQETDGLTILTQGGGDMLYGRRGEEIHRMQPFDITVRSTLGAGDTFKAGCVYALLNGFSDMETVRFASACSAVASEYDAVKVLYLPCLWKCNPQHGRSCRSLSRDSASACRG